MLKDATTEERAVYGEMLLSFLCVPARRYSVLCTASPMGGGGGKALRRRLTLIARRGAVKRTAAAMLALCVLLTCLVACTGRSGGGKRQSRTKKVYQKLARVADETEFVQYGISDGVHMAIGENAGPVSGQCAMEGMSGQGRTAPRLWRISFWVRAMQAIPSHLSKTKQGFAPMCSGTAQRRANRRRRGMRFQRQTPGMPAMSQIGGERTLYSTLPDGGEFVLVSSAPAMGYERHYLFTAKRPKPTVYDYGTIYTPIYGDLDEQYARVAEEFCFVSERVGFVSFRFELYETAPDLFRHGGRRENLAAGCAAHGGHYGRQRLRRDTCHRYFV